MNTTDIKEDNMESLKYKIFYKENTPSEDHLLHYHDFLEIYFQVQGDCDYIIDSKIYSLNQGDILLINSQKLHRAIIKDMTQVYRRYVIWLEYSYIEELLGEKIHYEGMIGKDSDVELLRLPCAQSDDMQRVLHNLCQENKIMDTESELLKEGYLKIVLLLLCRYSKEYNNIEEQPPHSDDMVQKVMEYIDHNYQSQLNIDDIASIFYVNKYYLMRRFKKHTQMTIMDYCKKRRLIVARNYLISGLSIDALYKLSGFNDYSNFYKAFKSLYHMSPREYKDYLSKTNYSTVRLAIESIKKDG